MEINKKNWVTFGLFFFSITTIFCQYSISGKLIDTENKYSRIVLEYVPSINELNSTYAKNIINSSTIDSVGNFLIQGNDLPPVKSLFRLSLLKKGVVAGISNGKWKNFIYLVLDNNSQLELINCQDISINFGGCHIEGSTENIIIQDFYDNILRSFDDDYMDLKKNNSELKKQFLHKKHTDILKNYCDTSNYLIPSLIAFTHINNIDLELKNNPTFFSTYLKKIQKANSQSPYVIEIKNQINSKQEILFGAKKEFHSYINWVLLTLLSILGIYTISLRKKLSKIEREQSPIVSVESKINSLSKKEIEVFQYIIKGKSNKEIAAILFIEVTTVKSHISKIYQKLGVKSRKEALNLGLKNPF